MPEKAFKQRGSLADQNQIVQNRSGRPDNNTPVGSNVGRVSRPPKADVSGKNAATASSPQRPVVLNHTAEELESTSIPGQGDVSTAATTTTTTAAAAAAGAGARPQSGKSNIHDSLQIIDGGSSARHGENTIWDWKPPVDTIVESESYLYEPQGELLHEDQHKLRQDFTIPQPVAASGVNWRAPASPFGSSSEPSFAIPGRHTSGVASTAGTKRKSPSDKDNAAAVRALDPKRQSVRMEESEEPRSPTDTRPGGASSRLPNPGESSSSFRPRSNTEIPSVRPTATGTVSESTNPFAGLQGAGARSRSTTELLSASLLPPRKVFPIQIGDKLFRLSGASISSDGPSYFTQFFEEQLRQTEGGAESVRTLYIDRDPATFEDIALHLQGYHVEPKDGKHFVKLFADAQFFSLPRLTAQLNTSTIYIRIGDGEFQIPRDLFNNPGDSPNYFSLGFSVFFSTPTDAFPGLTQRSLLRPPAILPPSVSGRSARTFADLLHILKGYPVEIRCEKHRQELLRDARWFNLKGLEQRLIPCSISYNLARQKSEIVVRIDDIRQSGVSFVADNPGIVHSSAVSPAPSASSNAPTASNTPGWIQYQRPYVDSESYSLVMEISGEECTFLSIAPPQPNISARIGRATFRRQMLARITSLFTVIANKMNLPVTQPLGVMMMERGAGVASLPVSPGNTGLSDEKVKVRIGTDADVIVDGKPWSVAGEDEEDTDESSMEVDPSEPSQQSKKRKRQDNDDDDDEGEEWVVKRAQWRLRVQPVAQGTQGSGKSGMEVILGAVKIEAFSSERQRNADRGFLH